tara:strand:- start:101 stop:370 length:270 start_codon:yes stop_codon:yes gene_type:complete
MQCDTSKGPNKHFALVAREIRNLWSYIMKVKIFRQRVSQVHESEVEINHWLEENRETLQISHIQQSSYMTDNSENAQPSFLISVWYNEL